MDAASLMAQAADLTHKVAELLAAGRVAEAEGADREARALRQRALRQARRAPGATSSAIYAPAESERETVVEGLTELDVIAPARLVSDYVGARFSRSVTPRLFSSLRRDERRAWERSGSSRPVFIVPALEGSYFTQARGMLALSAWPMWRRLVGPRTGRVELLRAAGNVLEQHTWLIETDDSAAARMERLLVTLVRTVPGALDGWSVRKGDRTREAIDRELQVLREADELWRHDAAERAQQQLDAVEQLWGAPPPHLVTRSGGASS